LAAGFLEGFGLANEDWLFDEWDLVFKQRAGFPSH